MFHVIITNQVPPVRISKGYISLPRHIRKDVLIRRNIASDICVAQQLVVSNFAKNQENVKGELCLNVIILFSIIACCLVIKWCSENNILSKPKWRAQATVKKGRGTRPSWPLVATARAVANQNISQNKSQNVRWRPKNKVFIHFRNPQISAGLVWQILLLLFANFTLCRCLQKKASDPKEFLGDPTLGCDP